MPTVPKRGEPSRQAYAFENPRFPCQGILPYRPSCRPAISHVAAWHSIAVESSRVLVVRGYQLTTLSNIDHVPEPCIYVDINHGSLERESCLLMQLSPSNPPCLPISLYASEEQEVRSRRSPCRVARVLARVPGNLRKSPPVSSCQWCRGLGMRGVNTERPR